MTIAGTASILPLVMAIGHLLLFFLACRAGEIQSRETLYLQLYKREYDGLDRTLDVRISHLRKKLGDAGAPDRIRTVWGRGYLFSTDA